MGIANTNDKLLEIASRRLFELGEKEPAYKQYCALVKSGGVASGLVRKAVVPIKPQITFGTVNVNIIGCPKQSCIGKSVLDLLMRRPKLFSFKEVCAILAHCDVRRNRNFIEDIILKYGVVIIGLPDCADEDLHLAVYFFIEDMFGIQASMELCVRIITENWQANVIGVVFDNVTTKEKIVEKLSILDDSGLIISCNFDINWIVNELCDNEAHV